MERQRNADDEAGSVCVRVGVVELLLKLFNSNQSSRFKSML